MGRERAIVTVSRNVTVTVLSLSRLQSVSDTPPATLVFPVGQLVHETEPADTANLPGSQLSQVDAPSAEESFPGSHLVQPEEPWVENVPAMQSEHAFTDADPSVAAYVPPAQAVLSFDPPAHQNPAVHSVPSADTDTGGQ